MSTEEDTELRDLVSKSLEANGVLNKIRAELRANLFMALEEQGALKDNKHGNQKLQRFLNSKEGVMVASIVREFLSFFDLDFTLAVFDPETCLDGKFNSRDEIVASLGLGLPSKDNPLLLELLQQSEQNGAKQQVKGKGRNDESPPCSPRSGSKIPQRIDPKSRSDISFDERSTDSNSKNQTGKVEFGKKSKVKSDFEDEDSELLAELGLLRDSNKEAKSGMKKRAAEGRGLGSLKDAPPIPGIGKKTDTATADMNSSGDWRDLAAIEAKINKLGFDIPKDDNFGYEDDFINSSSRKSEGLSITEEIEEDISIGSFAGSKGDDYFTTDQTVSQIIEADYDYAEDIDV